MMDAYLITWIVLLTIFGLGIIEGLTEQQRQKKMQMWMAKTNDIQHALQNAGAALTQFGVAIEEANKALLNFKNKIG